jgi:glycosyltransferase involved in cell wall biosynthesis
MSSPKVSICIPAYRQPELLKKCLDSVFEQEYSDFEVIVTDDTPDNSVKDLILNSYKEKKINYYKNEISLGTPANWNHAISKAKGEYIKIIHHDDFFTDKASLGKFVELIGRKAGTGFAFSASRVWSIKRNLKWVHSCSQSQLKRLKEDPACLFFGNRVGAPSAVIYRRDLGLEFDVSLKWLVDIDFYIRILKVNSGVAYSPEPFICTIDGAEGQVTQSVSKDLKIQLTEHVQLFEKIASEKINEKRYIRFFDDLFFTLEIGSQEELKKFVAIPGKLEPFFETVFSQLKKNRLLKKGRKRFYTSRYNKRFFKLEMYS